MSIISVINKRFVQVKKSIIRFPESILLSTTIVVLLIIVVENDVDVDLYRNIIMSLIFGFLITLDSILFIERTHKKQIIRIGVDGGIVLLVGLMYWIMPLNMTASFIIMYLSLCVSLFVGYTLMLYVMNREDYGFYLVRIVLNLLLTLLYTLVLFAGVSGLIFAVESLFEFDFSDMIYLDTMIILFGMFGVIYYLSTVEQINVKVEIERYPKIVKVLLSHIVIPLIYAYTIILYAYFLRILITFEWPKGIVASLVLWYGIFAYITYIATESIEFNKKWLHLFKKWFSVAFILPLIMMIISLMIRVNHYGITVLRYYVLIISIWFSFIILSSLIVKKQKAVYIALAGVILLLLSSIGPLSGLEVSYRSQESRLISILNNNQMINNNLIVKNPDISREDKKSIVSIIEYIESIDMSNRIEFLPVEFVSYKDFEDIFGFPNYIAYDFRDDYQFRIEKFESIDIKDGSVVFFDISKYGEDYTQPLGQLSLEIDYPKVRITSLDYEIDLNSLIDKVKSLQGDKGGHNQGDLTFTYSINKKEFTIVIKSIEIGESDNENVITDMQGLFIIKERN